MKILVPLDGTTESEVLLPWVQSFLGPPEVRVRLLHVAPAHEPPHECEGYIEKVRDRFRPWADRVEAGVEAGAPAAIILRFVRERQADWVALRTRSRQGVSRLLFGSVTAEVVQEARVPLLVAGPEVKPRNSPASVKAILVPVDGSNWSSQILDDAADLARRFQARVTLLHVGKAGPWMQTWVERLVRKGVPCTVSEASGHPATAILNHAGLGGYDLVAMATHGRSGVGRMLLDSVAEEVIRSCPMPVLLRRPV